MAVIGRERERRQVEAVLAGRGVRAVLLHGEAGIGKTVLWNEALEIAGVRGYRVVSTRPTEAEAKLPFVGLSDLLGDLVDAATERLPRPQLLALEAALMRTDVEGEPVQPLALSLGVLEVIRSASAARPLAIGIDDAGWLDESTGGVLRFALRRLGPEPVVVITTMRRGDAAPIPTVLADLDPAKVARIDVGPLGAREIDALLEEEAGLALPPAAHRRANRASEGNPLHALASRTGAGRIWRQCGGHSDARLADQPGAEEARRAAPEGTHGGCARRGARFVPRRSFSSTRSARIPSRTAWAEARRADVLGPGDDPIRSPTRSWRPRPMARWPTRTARRAHPGWRRSSRTPRSAPGILRWQRSVRTRGSSRQPRGSIRRGA